MGLQHQKRYFSRKPADTKNTTVGELIEHLRAFYKESYCAPSAHIALKEYLSEHELEKFKHIDLRDAILVVDKDEDGSTLFGITLIEQRATVYTQVEELIKKEARAKELLTVMLEQLEERMKNK